MSLIEPGLVGSDFNVDHIPTDEQQRMEARMEMLKAEDVAECIRFCLVQPSRCRISVIELRPLVERD